MFIDPRNFKKDWYVWLGAAVLLIIALTFLFGRLRAKVEADGVRQFQESLVEILRMSDPKQLAVVDAGSSRIVCTFADRLKEQVEERVATQPVDEAPEIIDVPSDVQ